MRTAARVVLIALVANVVALAVAQLVAAWLSGQALFEIDSSLVGVGAFAWGLAAAVVVAALAWTEAARSHAGRAGSAMLAVGCVVGLGWWLTMSGGWQPGDELFVGAIVVTLVLAMVATVRPLPVATISPRARFAVLALGVLGTLGWGQGALREARAEYDERPLPSFTLELVAAYHYDLSGAMPAVVVDARGEVGEVVSLEGGEWNLHRSDALVIEASEVRRVRWLADASSALVSLRFAESTRDAFEARSRRRGSQYDAVLIDGEPRALLFYGFGSFDRALVSSGDPRVLWRVYERLTAR